MKRTVLIGLLLVAWLIVGAKETSAKWKTGDPNCSALAAPDQEDQEAWLAWWGSCITDETQPPLVPPTPEPPPCRSRTFTSGGTCWQKVCLNDFEWILKPCIKTTHLFPHIKSLKVRTDGYLVTIGTKRGMTTKFVRPSQFGLLSLVRAMVHSSKLPTEDILRITPEFWSKQPKVVLTPKPVTRT